MVCGACRWRVAADSRCRQGCDSRSHHQIWECPSRDTKQGCSRTLLVLRGICVKWSSICLCWLLSQHSPHSSLTHPSITLYVIIRSNLERTCWSVDPMAAENPVSSAFSANFGLQTECVFIHHICVIWFDENLFPPLWFILISHDRIFVMLLNWSLYFLTFFF